MYTKAIAIFRKLIFLSMLCYCLFCGERACAGNFTGNATLNSFLKELYINIPRTSNYKATDLRLVQVARRCNQGGWIISVRDKQNKILASFQANSGFDERQTILPIMPKTDDGIYGYAIVDWSVIKDSTNNWSYPNDSFTAATTDLKLSPRLNQFINIPYTYVSESGDDSNVGSEQCPMRTIASAFKYKKPLRLKRGDIFYENVSDDGCNISAYGKGKNPKICGWKIIPANKGLWEEGKVSNGQWIKAGGTHIWRVDLETKLATGRISGNGCLNNIGLVQNNTTGESIGHKCEYMYAFDCKDTYRGAQNNTFLMKDGDFWQCSKKGKETFTSDDFRYLYIFSTIDPNQYSYRFSTYGNGFTLSNASVDGVDVEGFGCHGFGCGSNVRITHCTIKYVGGSQQIGYPQWVRFGNGIEFYGARENGEVAKNVIMFTFDCGTTIQEGCGDGTYAKNIVFHDNVISYCRQAFEYTWNQYSKTGYYHDVEGCAFINNKCMDNGHDNGFNSPEVRDAHILSYQGKGNKTALVIKGNTFSGGTGLLCAAHPDMLTIGKNVYILDDGAILWTNYNSKGNIVYSRNDAKAAIEAFNKKVGKNKMKFKRQ